MTIHILNSYTHTYMHESVHIHPYMSIHVHTCSSTKTHPFTHTLTYIYTIIYPGFVVKNNICSKKEEIHPDIDKDKRIKDLEINNQRLETVTHTTRITPYADTLNTYIDVTFVRTHILLRYTCDINKDRYISRMHKHAQADSTHRRQCRQKRLLLRFHVCSFNGFLCSDSHW